MSQKLDSIVRAARALTDPAARKGYLDEACEGDEALRVRVEAILQADDPTVDQASAAGAASSDETVAQAYVGRRGPLLEGPGTQLGPYRLLERIGEGGFGTVFLAEQETPIVRRVAVKLLKPGMDTERVVVRFEAERQALALMDHPHIARVIDAGATPTGRPYFVMDLVVGAPISDYCDQNGLTVEARLALFAQVCNAVQHAHTKGIIHRDIKPSNVLVSTHDGKAHAKVIDFGIAKATAVRPAGEEMFTVDGAMIGTPEYMSPEQAEGSLDIDARTDVYSLGVLLYELLTGSTPFSTRELRAAGVAEVRRIIREVDPPKPSTRLVHSAETLARAASKRRTAPKRLSAIIRGELDWIVMRALEKDRQQRYPTANALAMDIQRYLGGEPVVAAPPGAAYRLQKFVRRHRGGVLAAAAVAAALLVGAFAFAWQARVAGRQRDRAVAAEGEARKRADELRKVSDFQAAMLSQVDPATAGRMLTKEVTEGLERALAEAGVPERARVAQAGAFAGQWNRVNATDAARNLIDRTILKPAVGAIDARFADQPAVDAQLRQVLADLYKSLGLYEAAWPLQERALETRRRVLGEKSEETLRSIGAKGDLLRAQGKLAEAEPFLADALERSRRILGADHPFTLVSMNNLGYVHHLQGRNAEAESLCREALGKMRRVLGEDHRETLTTMQNVALALQFLGRLEESEAVYRDSLERHRRALGEESPETVVAVCNLGHLLLARGQFVQAEPVLREALEKSRRVLGEEHPDTVTAINNVGYALQFQGKLAEAEPFEREAIEKYRRAVGADHPSTLAAMNNLALLLQDQGKYAEAEALLRETLAARRRVLGEEHPDTIACLGNLGRFLQAVGRLAEAEPVLRVTLETKRRLRGADHPDTLTSINNYGAVLEAMGRLAEAETYYRDAMEKCRRVLGLEHPNTFITTINTGGVMQAQGKNADAVKVLDGVEPAARKAFTGANARWVAKLLTRRGLARTALGDLDAAEKDLLEAYPLIVASRGEGHKETRECVQALVALYTARQAAGPGRGDDVKAASWSAKLRPATPSPPAKR
ncbi:MAG: serine/threonine protein kinase [Holophagales bacterium]|nr:serine/threonine protein kinase [Holophagales bacterium]MBK9963417.1 serine/threonine protein kinase [Holophagales bacterium]